MADGYAWEDNPDLREEAERLRKAHRKARANGQDKAPSHKRQFKLIRFKDVTLNTNPSYLVENLIPREEITVVWGPPKSAKSFWVYDLIMHIVLGWEYRGRYVEQGPAVYVACEGARGLESRTAAYRKHRVGEDADPDFFLLTTRLDLVADADDLIAAIRAEIGPIQPSAIVIDTLNRSIPGSESRDEDMSAYVKAADRIREAFQAAVIVVHHCGVNGGRPRGHTSLTGAADAQIAIEKHDSGRITATVEYMKDGAEGDVIASRLEVVEVGINRRGKPITSCVVEEDEAPPVTARPTKGPRLSDAAKIALDTLRKAITEAGQDPPPSNHIPASARVVSLDSWRRFHYAGTCPGDDELSPEARKKAFQRSRDKLQAAKIIKVFNGLYWIVADV